MLRRSHRTIKPVVTGGTRRCRRTPWRWIACQRHIACPRHNANHASATQHQFDRRYNGLQDLQHAQLLGERARRIGGARGEAKSSRRARNPAYNASRRKSHARWQHPCRQREAGGICTQDCHHLLRIVDSEKCIGQLGGQGEIRLREVLSHKIRVVDAEDFVRR